MAGISYHTVLYAVLGGAVPTFLWLAFWVNHDDYKMSHELLLLTFMGGALGVMLLLPARPYVVALNLSNDQITILYAAMEELTKFILVALIAFSRNTVTEPTDYFVYLITGALGFSALENTFYLLNPLLQNATLGSLITTGNLRFFGATILHSMSVAIVGIMLGLAYSSGLFWKIIHTIVGLALAIALHTAFNYFIMQGTRQGTTIAIAGIWSVVVVVILLFDRLKAMNHQVIQFSDVAPNQPNPTLQPTV